MKRHGILNPKTQIPETIFYAFLIVCSKILPHPLQPRRIILKIFICALCPNHIRRGSESWRIRMPKGVNALNSWFMYATQVAYIYRGMHFVAGPEVFLVCHCKIHSWNSRSPVLRLILARKCWCSLLKLRRI